MKREILGVIAISLTLTGCSSQMSKTEACQLYVQYEAGTDQDQRVEDLKRLQNDAPSPMSDFIKARSAWLISPATDKDPQTNSYAEAERIIAERVGFDRAIYCSS
ncbi:hypothetical protein AFL94_08865 [Arthrobacter sp. LS16]|nr:hypothetical protein AFL94_08865 [Arthrobacter sp. LS16]